MNVFISWKKRLCELLIDVFDFGFFNLREGDCQLGFRHLADYELNRHCYIRLKIYLEHSKSLYINKESWSSSIYIHVITFNIKTWNTHFPIPDEDALWCRRALAWWPFSSWRRCIHARDPLTGWSQTIPGRTGPSHRQRSTQTSCSHRRMAAFPYLQVY